MSRFPAQYASIDAAVDQLLAERDAADAIEDAAFVAAVTDRDATIGALEKENADLRAKLPAEPPVEPSPEPPVIVVGRTSIDVSKLASKWFEIQSGKTYENILFAGNDRAGTGPQGANAMVRTRSSGVTGAHFKNCIVTGAVGCGISFKGSKGCSFTGGEIYNNGQLGIAASLSTDFVLRGTKVHHNNFGLASNPGWRGADGEFSFVQINGKWYAKEGFEAGGAKFTRTKGLVLDNCEWFANRGKGCWFDIENQNSKILNNRFYDNTSVGNVSWGGVGLLYELNPVGGLVIDGGEAHGNEGPGISINESRNVTINGFTFDGDNFAMRNSSKRRASSGVQNISVTGNTFKAGAKVERLNWGGSPTDAVMKIKITGNVGLN